MLSNNIKSFLVRQVKCNIRFSSIRRWSTTEDKSSPESTKTHKGEYDVIIAGGGMVGSSLACALAKDSILSNLKVLLLEGGPNKNFQLSPVYSNRVVALNQNTKSLMNSLNVWRHVEKMRLQPVRYMQVWDACSDAMIGFSSAELMDDDVAYIVENDVMLHAINVELFSTNNKNINIVYDSKIAGYELPKQDDPDPKSVVTMANGDTYTCQLLIGADGANSAVRKAMGVQYLSWSYEQMGVVATLNLSEECSNTTAWQRWLPTGPVAILPLDSKRSSLVWSTWQDDAKKLLQLPEDQFVDALNDALVLVALSFYATGSYQKLVGGTYGTLMSQQSVSRTIRDVTAALNHPIVQSKWIKFPQTRQERNAIKRRFFEKFKIPSVIGCIDGTHVAIIRPIENEERFFNRKHFHSRNVLIWKQYPRSSGVEAVTSWLSTALKRVGLPDGGACQLPPSVCSVTPGSRAAFPLGFGHSTRYVAPGVALIGDAAHRVHPLAGQGVNLGFGDVKQLSELLSDAMYAGLDITHPDWMEKYESERQRHNVPTQLMIEMLHRVYTVDLMPVVLARSVGLQLTNALQPLKLAIQNSLAPEDANADLPTTSEYLDPGHKENIFSDDDDAVHSLIEKQVQRYLGSGPIFVPSQYISAIRSAKKRGTPFIVNKMGYGDFIDIKKLPVLRLT